MNIVSGPKKSNEPVTNKANHHGNLCQVKTDSNPKIFPTAQATQSSSAYQAISCQPSHTKMESLHESIVTHHVHVTMVST